MSVGEREKSIIHRKFLKYQSDMEGATCQFVFYLTIPVIRFIQPLLEVLLSFE